MYEINLQGSEPVYEQIIKLILSRMIAGLLKENDRIPSVRQFAESSGINPNTVSKAYKELEREGIIRSVSGRGTFVNSMNPEKIESIILADFDRETAQALRIGIPKETLLRRIENIQEGGEL